MSFQAKAGDVTVLHVCNIYRPADLDNLGVFQDTNVFEEEVLLDGGIANALKHASMKGFMETTTERHGGVTVKDTSSLLAKNYRIEDKQHEYVYYGIIINIIIAYD